MVGQPGYEHLLCSTDGTIKTFAGCAVTKTHALNDTIGTLVALVTQSTLVTSRTDAIVRTGLIRFTT